MDVPGAPVPDDWPRLGVLATLPAARWPERHDLMPGAAQDHSTGDDCEVDGSPVTEEPVRELTGRILAGALPAEAGACHRGAGIALRHIPPGNVILQAATGYGAAAEACRRRHPEAAGICRRDDHGAPRPRRGSYIVARCRRRREASLRRARRPAGWDAVQGTP